ncbi:MAG: pentapeptide repeat-containing protein [Cyanobacteria bacterium P01_E01_bin.42]
MKNYRFANLTDQDFNGQDLRNADFYGADLTRVSFRHANLRGANFENATFKNTDFRGADTTGIRTSKRKFKVTREVTQTCIIEAEYPDDALSLATLSECDWTDEDSSIVDLKDPIKWD